MLNLQLIETQDVTDQVRLLEFQNFSGDALPAYSAGAHIDFELDVIGARAYSLIDWALEEKHPRTYQIAVQREDDGAGGSKAMHRLEIGSILQASHPKNDFELIKDRSEVLLL
ncbi:MAG: oxidoreductase, partial [Paracoccaceae bacterium]